MSNLAFSYNSSRISNATLVHADCFEWLSKLDDNSIHAVVTDPPYGVREYLDKELIRQDSGGTGVWRLPPVIEGIKRAPLPRFTDLRAKDIEALRHFFTQWSQAINRVLVPGGHVFVASNSFLSQIVFESIVAGGLEFRGELIRLVMTLRGGDRPKNAESEFPGVCTLPRGCYEPWGLFRKSLQGMRVQDCLREHKTGALRFRPDGKQFMDVIQSSRTPKKEREIAKHPSLKPQSFMRPLVWSALPLGKGIVLDPFAGSGSTLAAAISCGYESVGIERYKDYYDIAKAAIPRLANRQAEFDIPLFQSS